jgi:hypothetical protein
MIEQSTLKLSEDFNQFRNDEYTCSLHDVSDTTGNYGLTFE